QLRRSLPAASIYILNGVGRESAERFHQARLIPVLNTIDEVRSWASIRHSAKHECALNIDTGMQRLGLEAEEFLTLVGNAALLDNLQPVLVMSHLASSEVADNPTNPAQLTRFNQLIRNLPASFDACKFSLANSSGIFLGGQYHFDLCRAGAACYGVNPQPTQTNPMQPVLTVSAPVIQIRTVRQASGVGYGGTASVAPGDRLAVIGAGYGDGYPRHASNHGQVQIGEWLAPVTGNVSMDLITVNISHIPAGAIEVGDSAYLLNSQVTIDQLAAAAGTIGYEILTTLAKGAQTEFRPG
ncbi:MAG: alanine racemase, partial [Gammaproteobacteria bacterium]